MNMIFSSFQIFYIVLLFFSYSNATRKNLKPGDACAHVCSGKENIFKFEEEKIYSYNFLSRHSVKNPNSESEAAQLELTGKVDISKSSSCDFMLQLSEITLTESVNAKESVKKNYDMMKKLLEKYSLRFGFDDGHVVGVCPDNKDNEFAVNVKKAIISSLQVSVDSLDAPNYLTETDISGDCMTEYTNAPEPPNFVIIKKTKSISGCARKNKYFSTIQGQVFEEPMENQNFALLLGEYSCDIKMKRSEGLKESICKEVQTFKPFASETKGSSIVINHEIRFDSVKSGKIPSSTPYTREDLIMNHGNRSPLSMKSKNVPIMDTAKQLCAAIKTDTDSLERTKLFVKFIRSLSESNFELIQNVDRYFNENSECSANKVKLRNILLDALPYAKTDDAYRFLLEDAKLYKFQKLGFSFIESATPALIEIVLKKLDDSKMSNHASLTLTSMIKSFCEKTPGCMLNPIVIKSMNRLLKNLNNNCDYQDDSSREKILFTLRAIGNAGDYPNYIELISTLESCINLPSSDDDIKSFSIEAVRQFPCNDNIDKFLWTIYDGVSLTSEIRIQAYLSLIRCPTRDTFRKVIQKLETENSQQLGSFVWSHISNLMETSDRFKIDLREMLQIFTKPIESLSKKFNLDFRSYSKNIEKTYHKGHSAAKIDSNVIFSSYPLPSSVTTNLTIDALGRSINILEIGVQGNSGDGMYTMFLKAHKDPHADIVKMDKKNEKKSSKRNLSMYFKIMGREIFFTPNILSDLTKVAKSLTLGSFEKSLLLLDTTVSISSITGFPIELSVVSVLSADLQWKTSPKITMKDFSLFTKNNVAIQINGKLLVNAHCTKIGVKSSGTLSSDTEFEGKIKITSTTGNIVSLSGYQFEITKIPDNRKILSISNEMSLIHKTDAVETKPKYEVLLDKCTGHAMLELRGIKMCASVSTAKRYGTYFPNLKAELKLNTFNGFRFLLKEERSMKPLKKLTHFILSVSFQGNDKDTFKLQFRRNLKEKIQSYELSLWDKDIYFLFDINKEKVSGKLKYGQNEAEMNGSINSTSVFQSTINLNVKSKTDEMVLFFQNKFTKAGPQITIYGHKKKDKEFLLKSKTTVTISEHKHFNYFQRFRHSTTLKVSGNNEFSILLESSTGNIPAMELKATIKTYWKTQNKYNFNIKQHFVLTKGSVVENDLFHEKLPGTIYGITLDQLIQIKNKNLNLTHSLSYFISNDFNILGDKPSLIELKLESFDLLKKKFIRQINSKLFLDLISTNQGKVHLKAFLNHPSLKFYQNLKGFAMWKRNSLDMYDLEAEIQLSELLQIQFNHKFTTTQNGISSLEIKAKESIFKINSELMLPKSHTLTISYPGKSLVIESKVDTKSLMPFNTSINHEIRIDNKLIASIINIIEYNAQKSKFSFNSIGKNIDETLYAIDFGGQLKENFSPKKYFYDFIAKSEIKIPKKDIDFIFKTKQFTDIDFESTETKEKTTFESKVIFKDNKNDEIYGYKVAAKKGKGPESVVEIKKQLFTGKSSSDSIITYSRTETKSLYGVSINSTKLHFEYLFKLNREIGKLSTSVLAVLDLKKNDKFNFYYKNNAVFIYKTGEHFSLEWDGEYGKLKNVALKSTKGSFKFYRNSEQFDINLELTHPLLEKLKLSKIMLGHMVKFSLSEKFLLNSKTIVKWQKENSRTANYYDLELKGVYDNNQDLVLNLEGLLTKDSTLEKKAEFSFNLKKTRKLFESNFKFIRSDKNANLSIKIDTDFPKNFVFLFSIKSSSVYLKELTLSSDINNFGKTYQVQSQLIFDSTKLYQIDVTQIRKIDFNNGFDMMSKVKWVSNIPYVTSGSYILGILVYKFENFKINYSLNYKNAKKLNIKFSADTKAKEIQAFAESYVVNPVKFSLHGSMSSSNAITFNSEFGYKESFLKIQNTNLNWKSDKNVISSEFTTTILSSNEDFNDIIISSDMYFEVDNFLKTFKKNIDLKYKGKSIHSGKLDLSTGEIKIDSLVGQYTKYGKFNNLKLDLKYHFNSIRDMSLKYVFYAEPVFEKSEFEFIYYRQQSGDPIKEIETFGKALFFYKLQYNQKEKILKAVVFIDQEMNKGIAAFKVNLPKYTLNYDDMSFNINIEKKSENVYEGKAIFKTTEYQYKFESFGSEKKLLQITAISKTEPDKILLSYDITNNVIIQIKVNKIFDVEIKLKGDSNRNKVGTIVVILKETEILNLKYNSDIQVPKDIVTLTDYLQALIGIQKGIHLKYSINGKISKWNIKREVEIYHLRSEMFSGGIKSFYKTDTFITGPSTITLKSTYYFDRNFPLFKAKGNMYLKVDDEVILDRLIKIKFISKDDFMIDSSINIKNHIKSEILVIYNKDIIQGNFLLDIPIKDIRYGFGFQKLKKNNRIGSHLVCSKTNYTMETNVGDLIHNSLKSDYFPIGQEYFIDIMKKYVVRMHRKKKLEFQITINYDWNKPIKMSIELFKSSEKKFSLSLKGTTSFEKIEQFHWKLIYETRDLNFIYLLSLSVNKKTISELSLNYMSATETSPITLDFGYKGHRHIIGTFKLCLKNYQLSYSVTAKDGTFKTLLWTSTSKCYITPVIDCYLNHSNSARDIIIGTNWENKFKRLELTWNKNKYHSLILSITKKENTKTIILENPLKCIIISHMREINSNAMNGLWDLDIKSADKSVNNDITLKLKYKMQGSLKSDYNLELNLKTNLLKKDVTLTMKRDVSVDIGDLYALQLQAFFDEEKLPFLGIKGYLRQLSSRSYEINLHCTNYEKFAKLTTTFIFASEEITLEYKLIQTNQPQRDFLIQYIPFKKLHITNKKDFKILLSKIKYQYGSRGDYALQMGSDGANLVAYSTYTRNPMKYYVELKNKDQKTVVHLRYVGDSIIGELYRKSSTKRTLDASLKMNVDNKNILSSKLYWDPNTFDRMKDLTNSVFDPQHMKKMMFQMYENNENHLSKFLTNLKLDILKNVNVAVCLEFMKGIVNELENFPKSVASSYENDDYFIKTILKKLETGLSSLDIPSKFNKFQSYLSELKTAIFTKIYEFFVDAKLYSSIYHPLKNSINSFSYKDIQILINKLVNGGKCVYIAFKDVVTGIGNVLDIISKKAQSIMKTSDNILENIELFYKNSFLMNVVTLLSDIKDEILNILTKIMKSSVVKQRIQYYQDAIKDSDEIFAIIKDFKNKTLQNFKTSNLVINLIELGRLIQSMKYKEAFLNFFKLEETDFKMNLDEASIELRFYVPPMSRKCIKIVKTLINWVPLEAMYQVRKSSLAEKLLQLYYRYEYIMFNYGSLSFNTIKKLFPPFPREAWVLNGNSVLTFDGNSVRIGSGKCAYLLARDFNTKSFSLIMIINPITNEKEFELSYTKKISILQSGLVKVDGEIVNILPKSYKESLNNFVIYRDNDFIKVKTSEGILIKYFPKLDSFKLKLTGSWHGNVKGLFGLNDFDAVNDLATPNGLITHDAGIFAKSWSLGDCETQTKTGLHMIKVDPKKLQECVNLFHPDSESYIKRCHYLINPEPYFELCHRSLKYVTESKMEFKDILCSLSRNYVMRCKANGIMIRLHKSCVKCGKKSLNSKVSVINLSKKRKFNYIFIMEQSTCLLPYENLIQNLVNIMGLNSDNLFTLLSYNGKDFFKEVHFKSIDNKINTNKDGFSQLLKEFWSSNQVNMVNTSTTILPSQAIYEAIKMSSLQGYTEKIVLIGCSICAENQKYIYSMLAGLLNNAGISITYLTTQSLIGTEASLNTVGLGNKLVYYFEKDSDTIKNRPWKRNVQAPKDSCSPLARLKQGFVWSLKPMDSDNKQRRSAEAIYVELEKSAYSPMQSCFCTAGNYDDGSIECKTAKSRLPASNVL